MRFAIVAGAALLLVTSGVARAADEVEVGQQRVAKTGESGKKCPDGGHCREAVSPPATPYYAIPEHQLQVVESSETTATAPRAEVSEDLEPLPEWDWPRKHLQDGRRFIDSYFGSELYPEMSVGTTVAAAQVAGPRTLEFGSQVDLSLYFLDVRVPIVNRIDGEQPANQRVDLDLKIPFAWPGSEALRFAVIYGALIAPDGPALSNSSRFELMAGYGGPVSLQLRGGYGYRELTLGGDPELGLLYGAIVGVNLGVVQPSVELDAIRTTGTRSDRISVIPGFRLFPAGDQTFQIGLGALLVFGDGELLPDDRYGAVFNIGYNFL